MTDMVERVAEAIAMARGFPPETHGRIYRTEARAAIEAMRTHWEAENRFESARADIDAALQKETQE